MWGIIGSNKDGSFFGSPGFVIVLLLITSITSGHITTALYSIPGSRLEFNLVKHVGWIQTMALLFGLFYGSTAQNLSLS